MPLGGNQLSQVVVGVFQHHELRIVSPLVPHPGQSPVMVVGVGIESGLRSRFAVIKCVINLYQACDVLMGIAVYFRFVAFSFAVCMHTIHVLWPTVKDILKSFLVVPSR